MKKIGLVCLVVVIALGAMGFGYATWTQALNVTGTLAAGTFDVQFTGTPGTTTAPSEGSFLASATDAHNATINISNAYPGYSGTATFPLKNTGSISASATIALGTIIASGGGSASDLTVNVTPASATTMAPGATDSGDFTVQITMNGNVTGSKGASYSIPVTITATQLPAPPAS